ncbi:DUF6221 family protein [Aeromicrobium sp. 9AM]|uniref:DUF6221 family protein n=1 Tax=Aeromicrobium sp. 9AM TaxID=2653126 RepID=UPI0012EF91C9|nr:DUF6221 family protein [Aeromicrobium sp. 9AM]VXC09543.1 hypothetical protein AERO9AM_50037 [Aeromicrobium sp. 9AM]
MTTDTATLTDWLLSRIAADEAAALAVPPLDHNFDMGGNRQDERFTFGRTLPSSADGMGNWSKYRDDPSTAAHFARNDPARVLATCKAHRAIVELAAEATGLDLQVEGEFGVGKRDPIDDPYLGDQMLKALASIYAGEPGFQEGWSL